MTSVEDARKKMMASLAIGGRETRSLSVSSGYVISKNIYSPLDLPPFHQSAMDGYAMLHDDVISKKNIAVVGESSAGKSFAKKIASGEAVRIFTGAEIPKGANMVVMQEKMNVKGAGLEVEDENIFYGMNIRTKGSQVKKGALAVEKGTMINAGVIGFLASMGIEKVPVYRKPSVALIITGNELQKAGRSLKPGNIYESNSATLKAALKKEGIENVSVYFARDHEKVILKTLRTAMRSSDFILFTGGISVGDYDFVGNVLKTEMVREIFYKVRQKPGKPLYYGISGKGKKMKSVFGLPGNPASVLSCYYEYVLPAIRKCSGHRQCFLPSIQLPVTKPIKKKKGLTYFMKAITDFNTVTPLDGQESYIMKSFGESNCLICLPEDVENISPETIIEVHLIN